jgi:hypothetical protein
MRRMGVLAMMTRVLVGFEAGSLEKWLVLKKSAKGLSGGFFCLSILVYI